MLVDSIEILPEDQLRDAVDLLVRLVEAAGAAIIFVGALIAMLQFLRVLPSRAPERFTSVRLTLGRFLALGLEFQLASDVLRTPPSRPASTNWESSPPWPPSAPRSTSSSPARSRKRQLRSTPTQWPAHSMTRLRPTSRRPPSDVVGPRQPR